MAENTFIKGRIIKGIGGFYYVRCDRNVYQCRARGKFKKNKIIPSVGDFVDIEIQKDGDAVVKKIYQRKNSFIRPPVSNIDMMVIVVSAGDPETELFTLDKLLVTAEKSDVEILICINKIDEQDTEKTELLLKIYSGLYPVVCVSAEHNIGIEEMKVMLQGKDVVLAGVSGVGKSTLLNRLHFDANMSTGEISSKTGRGKHTTRHVELFDTDSGFRIFDTPGFSSFDVPFMNEDELDELFPEIWKYSADCKYKNCSHINEPSCAVRDAVEEGLISRFRFESYKRLFNIIKDSNCF